MSKDFRSSDQQWKRLAQQWSNNSNAAEYVKTLEKAYAQAQEAVRIVNSLGDVGSLSIGSNTPANIAELRILPNAK